MLECKKVDKSEGFDFDDDMCERRNRGDMFGQDMKALKFVTISKQRFDYLCEIERKYYKVQKTVGVHPGLELGDRGVLQSKVLGDPQEGIKRRYQQTCRKYPRVIQFAKHVRWILMTLNP